MLSKRSRVHSALLAACIAGLLQAALAADEYDGNPDALRAALLGAAAAGDQERLDALCVAHRSTIYAHFESWRTIPVEFRDVPGAVDRYQNGLRAIARHFARQGDRTLIGVFEATAARAKMLGWLRSYNDAEFLLSQARCAQAVAILQTLVGEMSDWTGTSVSALASRVRGTLGVCYRRLQDYANALKWTYSAYQLSVKLEDTDGIITYSGDMAEIYRRQGDDERFREWVDATAGVMESAGRDAEARALRAEH